MSEKNSSLLINCDMGEWDAAHITPCDDEIMPYIDMCNVACGGHAGNELIITQTIISAEENNVKIGAHPGFEDRENFGRKYISLPKNQLYQSLKTQLLVFLSVCAKLKIQPFHLKAHGALYHACNHLEMEAKVLVDLAKEIDPNLILLTSSNSYLEKIAKSEGLTTMSESFIDRRYNEDLTLVSRSKPNAVISNIDKAKDQYDLLSSGRVTTIGGEIKSLYSTTACIHGDNPNCKEILKAIRSED